MSQNKYYTPEVQDLFVGYECELKNPEWRPISISKHYLPRAFTKLQKGLIRTPYLTKDQIISEGWEDRTHELNIGVWAFEKGNYMMRVILFDKLTLDIHLKDVLKNSITERSSNGRVYLGPCPSINEFRKICKLLSI